MSLELYLVQYHVWLAHDAKALLVVLPGAPWLVNALLTSWLMYGCACVLHASSRALVASLVPADMPPFAVFARVFALLAGLLLLSGLGYADSLRLLHPSLASSTPTQPI